MHTKMSKWMAIAAMGLTACTVTAEQSNDPDSGINCADTDGGGVSRTTVAGSGTLSGIGAFTVRAAYEGTDYEYPYQTKKGLGDAGVTGSYLNVVLLSDARSCNQFQQQSGFAADAGTGAEPLVYMFLVNDHSTMDATDYPIGATSGPHALLYVSSAPTSTDAGTSQSGAFASSGNVHLGSVSACSLSGSFDVQFAPPDGGASDGGTLTGELSGTFAPVYCQ